MKFRQLTLKSYNVFIQVFDLNGKEALFSLLLASVMIVIVLILSLIESN